jgi:TolB protein
MIKLRLLFLVLPIPCLLLSACAVGIPSPTPSATLPPTPTATSTPTPTLAASPTAAATQTPWIITATPVNTILPTPVPVGTFFLALDDGGYSHLFAYSPGSLGLTRLTAGSWDDITPSLSPDGTQLAYASRRNGYYDLYLLDLRTGAVSHLTNTLSYNASPSWSPDGQWIAYESYLNGSLNILVSSASDPSLAPQVLTQDSSFNRTPSWSPRGRQIAFVSNRSGQAEIWIADLDKTGAGEFTDISQSPESVNSHPAWSPDGTKLAWASSDPVSGLTSLMVWDATNPTAPAQWVGPGDWPVWLDNGHLASRLQSPLQTYLTAIDLMNGTISLAPVLLPGTLNGYSYGQAGLAFPGPFSASADVTPAPLVVPTLPASTNLPGGRINLASVPNLQAPYPQLSTTTINAFQALRARVAQEIGWDALADLENAFVPLSIAIDPGMDQDWLYTGRAISLNPALVNAGWMVVVREDIGQETYWRIYLRTLAQDGSQGEPLEQVPWDFSARTGSPSAYENGGQLMSAIPGGYWLDLTALAAQYGWSRQPALVNWRTYYTGARFNELVFTQGLDWQTAMLQLYPPEAISTPTVVIPPTWTPTRTSMWYRSPTPTRTPTPAPTQNP